MKIRCLIYNPPVLEVSWQEKSSYFTFSGTFVSWDAWIEEGEFVIRYKIIGKKKDELRCPLDDIGFKNYRDIGGDCGAVIVLIDDLESRAED